MRHGVQRGCLGGLRKAMLCVLSSLHAYSLVSAADGFPADSSTKGNPKVVILGFDGLDPQLCGRWMDQGLLPNLSRLSKEGSFRELATTYPCQSPVAWRTFATGVNPGGHGIFDFLRRIPDTYLPTPSTVATAPMPVMKEHWKRIAVGVVPALVLGLASYAATRRLRLRYRAVGALLIALIVASAGIAGVFAWVPSEVPQPVNRAGGTPFWKHLSDAGLRSTLLRMPVEFPAHAYPRTRILSGLGVPDVRGANGTYTIFTEADETVKDADTEMGGRIIPIQFSNGSCRAQVSGPPNVLKNCKERVSTELILRKTPDRLEVKVADAVVRLKEGEWSDWVPFSFSASPLVTLKGMGRFHLLQLVPRVRLYLSAVNFDPTRLPPNVQLSSPEGFASSLCKENGFFKTLGWPTDTWALAEEQITDADYLQDFHYTFAREREVTLAELTKRDWDCFCAVFTPTDQIQHMFYRYLDAGAGNTAPSDSVSNAILKAYEEADAFVGSAMKDSVDVNTTLIVLSDHGFHPYRKSVNINTWLWKNGYLKLRNGQAADGQRNLDELYSGSDVFWKNVDWSGTYAYAMGLGSIYLNLEGREPRGVVRAGEMAEIVLAKLKEGLLALKDPETGASVVRSVCFGRDLYRGPFTGEAPDVIVGFQPGYRISWQTALGGIPPEVIEINARKWSGDHCSVDPAVTPGVLFTNRKLADGPVSILDAAPSILGAVQCPVPAEMEGKAWWR